MASCHVEIMQNATAESGLVEHAKFGECAGFFATRELPSSKHMRLISLTGIMTAS